MPPGDMPANAVGCDRPAARDLVVPTRDERPLAAAAASQQPGCMEEPEATCRRHADNEVAAPARRLVVIVGKPAGDGSTCRIEEPDRLLRVWSLLQATYAQSDWAELPPEAVLRLQCQLRTIRPELERAVSPPLAAELQRILPSQDDAPSTGALRIEYAALLSWAGSLMVEMLDALTAARGRRPRQAAAA